MPIDINKLTKQLELLTFNRHTIFVARNNTTSNLALREVSVMIHEASKAELLTNEEKILLIKGCEQLGLYTSFSDKKNYKAALAFFNYALRIADFYENPPYHLETMVIYLNLVKKQDNNDQALAALRNATRKLKEFIEEEQQQKSQDGIFTASELYLEYMHCYAFLLRTEAEELLKRYYTTRKTPDAKAEYENKFPAILEEAYITLEQLPSSDLAEAELARVWALRGWGLYLSKQYVPANDSYVKALTHWDNFEKHTGVKQHFVADTNYHLGLVRDRLNAYSDAIIFFEAAISIAKDFFKSELNIFVVEVKYQLALAYVAEKKYKEAYEKFARVLVDAKTIKFEKVITDTEAIMNRLTASFPWLLALKDSKDSKDDDASTALASLSITRPQHSVRFFPTEPSLRITVESPPSIATPSTQKSSRSVSFAP